MQFIHILISEYHTHVIYIPVQGKPVRLITSSKISLNYPQAVINMWLSTLQQEIKNPRS